MRPARWVLVSGLGGVIVVVTGFLTLNHALPVAVGHTQDQEAFLGVWRLFAGCVVLIGALLQTRWRVLGAVLTLLFGLFEIFVNVVSRDVIQWPFTGLASGALLAAIGGGVGAARQAEEPSADSAIALVRRRGSARLELSRSGRVTRSRSTSPGPGASVALQ